MMLNMPRFLAAISAIAFFFAVFFFWIQNYLLSGGCALVCFVYYLRYSSLMNQKIMGQVWALEGYDTFEDEPYPLQGVYYSDADARSAARDRLKHLETIQPERTSGGQTRFGIQDRVYLIHPDGHKERITL